MEGMIVILMGVAVAGVVVIGVLHVRSRGKAPVEEKRAERKTGVSGEDIKALLFRALGVGVIFWASYVYVEHYGDTGRQAALSSCLAVADDQGLEIAWQADEEMQVGPGIGRSGAPEYFRYFDGWTPSGDQYSCHARYERYGSRAWSAVISQESR